MGKDEETEELIKIFVRVSKRPFDRLKALSGVEGLKETKIVIQGATSLFDVGRWMFDVGRSSFNMFDVHLLKQARMA
jgi:hypothetical protein